MGEGVVRGYLAAGADVVVPTRSAVREQAFREAIGNPAPSRLHLFTHDYTTFAGAEALVSTMRERLGGIDDVVASIGGFWAGKTLAEIAEDDWQEAFVGLATTHMAVARAALPHLTGVGAYTVVVGQSAEFPVPGSGLVSMEQAALLMMQQVLAAESGADRRVFAFVLGPVRTRFAAGEEHWISNAEIGAAAVAVSASAGPGEAISLASSAEARQVVDRLAGSPAEQEG